MRSNDHIISNASVMIVLSKHLCIMLTVSGIGVVDSYIAFNYAFSDHYFVYLFIPADTCDASGSMTSPLVTSKCTLVFFTLAETCCDNALPDSNSKIKKKNKKYNV